MLGQGGQTIPQRGEHGFLGHKPSDRGGYIAHVYVQYVGSEKLKGKVALVTGGDSGIGELGVLPFTELQ